MVELSEVKDCILEYVQPHPEGQDFSKRDLSMWLRREGFDYYIQSHRALDKLVESGRFKRLKYGLFRRIY